MVSIVITTKSGDVIESFASYKEAENYVKKQITHGNRVEIRPITSNDPVPDGFTKLRGIMTPDSFIEWQQTVTADDGSKYWQAVLYDRVGAENSQTITNPRPWLVEIVHYKASGDRVVFNGKKYPVRPEFKAHFLRVI
jgi:hypothetical protein